jgi:uncharacterized protein (TIGR02996 family)
MSDVLKNSLVRLGDNQARYAGLLADIRESPDDDTPRRICADWLDEHGQPDGQQLAACARLRRCGQACSAPGRIGAGIVRSSGIRKYLTTFIVISARGKHHET